MARGINKVILIGNVGKDPTTAYLPSGSAVTNITVATSESWKDKQSGEMQERTEWHKVVFFNRLAEIAGQYLKKGSKVYVEGSLRTRQWEKDGQKHYTTEIVASEMQMLDGKGGGAGSEDHGFDSDVPPERQQPAHTRDKEAPRTGGGGGGDFDDDIPFAPIRHPYLY